MPPQIYRLSPEGIRQEKRTALQQGIFVIIFSTLVGVGLPTLAGIVPLSMWWILLPVLLAMFLIGLRRMLQLLQDRWDSFQIILGPTSIMRTQTGVPEVEITCEQVVQI